MQTLCSILTNKKKTMHLDNEKKAESVIQNDITDR